MAFSRREFLIGLGEVLGVGAVAVAGGWMARGAMLPIEESAALQFDRTHVAFGRVSAGPELSAAFVVRNTGSRRLVLRERGPGCDCLGEGSGSELIEPGETLEITGTLPTRGQSGPIRRELQFATNDPRQPVVTLVLEAEVVSE